MKVDLKGFFERTTEVERDEFLKLNTVVGLSKERPWTGEGLPPVGTVCEFRVETDDWRSCEVIAHHGEYAVCWIHCNKILASSGHAIRPIRTPEQIATEEREKAIDEMLALRKFPEISGSPSFAEAIYDAGYRKQAAK